MKILKFLIIASITLFLYSCNLSSGERANYMKLQKENDSLRKVLAPYDKQREENISNSSGLILNGKISIQAIETGYVASYYGGIFCPTVSMKFLNIAGSDLKETIKIKGIFIDNKTGEQLDDDYAYVINYGDIFLSGANKQIKIECSVGWYIIGNQDVSVKLYVNDKILQTMKIKNEEYYGRI